MERRYSADELLGMTANRLQEIAAKAGLKRPFNKNQNRQKRAEMILKHYAKEDIANKAGSVGKPADGLAPSNPAFEASCQAVPLDGDAPPTSTAAEDRDKHGGARPGAGRPLGMTAERARLTHVTETPHRLYVALFKALFAAWAAGVGTDKIELTQEEAIDIALPWSQLGEYYGWNERIPEVADIIICGAWTTANTFKLKARIAREFKADLKRRGVTLVEKEDAVGTWIEEVRVNGSDGH